MSPQEPLDEFSDARNTVDKCISTEDMKGLRNALFHKNKIAAMYAARRIIENDLTDLIPDLVKYTEQFEMKEGVGNIENTQLYLLGQIVEFINKKEGTSYKYSVKTNPSDYIQIVGELNKKDAEWVKLRLERQRSSGKTKYQKDMKKKKNAKKGRKSNN